jgi:hypothetical protein
MPSQNTVALYADERDPRYFHKRLDCTIGSQIPAEERIAVETISGRSTCPECAMLWRRDELLIARRDVFMKSRR